MSDRLSDTTAEAAEVQLSILRKLGPERRSQLTAEWSDAMRETALQGIRVRHPNYSERKVVLQYARQTLTPELFAAAFGAEWAALS
jgi:hypothetical protein